MRFKIAFPVLSLLCASCGAVEIVDRNTTTFEPLPNGSFRYEAFANSSYPHDDLAAEKTRVKWLEQFLNDNDYCPDGYRINERKAVLKMKGSVGDIYDLFYYGSCL